MCGRVANGRMRQARGIDMRFPTQSFPTIRSWRVWPDAYYITFNMFGPAGGGFTGGQVCAYDRAKMLTGLPAIQVCLQNTSVPSPLPSDLEGQDAAPGRFAELRADPQQHNNTSLHLWKFHPNFVTPANSTFTGPTAIPVTAFTGAWPFRSRTPRKSSTR